MNPAETEKTAGKAAMKALREERQNTIAAARALVKAQNGVFKSIKGLLKEGPRTVPEISQALSIDTSEILWSVMSLKKYGMVQEGEQDGSYFKYGLADSDSEGGEA